jgi:hypothetical protein
MVISSTAPLNPLPNHPWGIRPDKHRLDVTYLFYMITYDLLVPRHSL